MRRWIAFALVGGLALTACSSDDAKTAPLPTKRTAAAATTSTTAPAAAHTPGSLRHLVGARTDVHDTSCASTNGTWNAKGKVTNPTSRAANYRVYVSFLDGDTTVGVTEADVGRLAAKATTDWHSSLPGSRPGLRCILRVERATA